ncbi:hypothetical protein, conserved [Angomonas deanei]|uniref:Uncharacterized protein n=1 Tax=Angomonas deanei TaxID=59799 RepID=A0A7G2CR81_9TRYP|nr:hypothetical protein, conserved [Angomonas deanei]
MPFIQKKVPPTEEEAALQARQDAWRALIEEQEKELQEQEEKEKLAEEKRRLKQERKEKIKQEKEKEDLLLIEAIMNKRKEIPLSNRFIFEID